MRRGSLVGPLLLIGIGALFLARNVMPELPLLDYLAQYWPFLLVLWGSLRLLEIATWSLRGSPLPRYGVSGGEWILVIFLCVFGLSLHAVRGFTSWLPQASFEWGGLEIFGESYDYPLEARTAGAGAAPRVVIEGLRGSARITGSDTNEVKVTGRTSVRSMDRSTADRLAHDTSVEVTPDGSQVVIRVRNSAFDLTRDRGPFEGRVRTDLEIAVPKGASISATARDGDLDVSAVEGPLEIRGSNSNLRLENTGGVRVDLQGSSLVRAVNVRGAFELRGRGNDIDLEKIQGQVTVEGTWGGLIQARELARPLRWKGPQTELSAQALPGDLRMTIGDIGLTNVTGPLRIESTYPRDVTIAGVQGETHLDLQRGDIRISSAAAPGPIRVRLNAGNVDLTLPTNAKFNVNAVTERGEAYTDFDGPFRQQADGRRGSSITGSNGGPEVDIRINRGDITLRRSGSGGVSPAALPTVRPPSGSPPRAIDQ